METYYIIECYSAGKNSHCTDRSESWVLKKREAKDARLAVLEYNRVHSDMVLLCGGNRDLYESFCFGDDKNYHRRRAFLEEPDPKRLKTMLQNDGVVMTREE